MTDKKETKTKKSRLRYREKGAGEPRLRYREKGAGEDSVYIETVGRRKTSVARVRYFANEGTGGEIVINGKKLNEYFPTDELRGIVESPLKKAKIEKYKITVRLSGGGYTRKPKLCYMASAGL